MELTDGTHGQLQPPQIHPAPAGPHPLGLLDPSPILTKRRPFFSVIEAYKDFDLREPGWIKVKLEMQGV